MRRERKVRGAAGARFAALAAAALICLPGRPALSQTPDPMEHREGTTSGPIVESPEAMTVTSQIQCYCGGCVNQTLHDCTCGTAARERQDVAAALAAGRTPESLIAAYVAEHGPQVRIVPEKRGLNLVGWWIPFAAAAAALIALLAVLMVWRRRGVALDNRTAGGGPGRSAEAERHYRDRLERELKEFDA